MKLSLLCSAIHSSLNFYQMQAIHSCTQMLMHHVVDLPLYLSKSARRDANFEMLPTTYYE